GDRRDEVQGMADLRAALDQLRVRGERVLAVGRRLVGGARRAGLQRRLRHPPGGGRVRIRCRGGGRPPAQARPRARRAQQPPARRDRRGPPVAPPGTGPPRGTPPPPPPPAPLPSLTPTPPPPA